MSQPNFIGDIPAHSRVSLRGPCFVQTESEDSKMDKYQARTQTFLAQPPVMAYLLKKVVPEFHKMQVSEIAGLLGAPVIGTQTFIAGADYDVAYTGLLTPHRPFLGLVGILSPGNRYMDTTAPENVIARAFQLDYERCCGAGPFAANPETNYVYSVLLCQGIPDTKGNRAVLGYKVERKIIYGEDKPPFAVDSYAVRLDGIPCNDTEQELLEVLHIVYDSVKTEKQVGAELRQLGIEAG